MIKRLSSKPVFSSFRQLPVLALVVFFATITNSWGQSTCSTPTQISGFGVDGDLNANSPAAVLGDSWFSSPSFPGIGVGIIGSSALTASPAISASQFGTVIQAAPTQQGRNRTYLQRMAFPFLTNINGNTLIDAFAVRDYISPDTTSFTGSNKNGDNPTIWSLGPSSVPNKNDIIDAGGHLRRSGSNNKLWMFAYLTKLGTSGDSYTDIEIYRQVPTFNPVSGSFSNTGPSATGGHTTFSFSSNGSIVSPGDILVCINYNSSSGVASVRVWCNINNLDGNGNGIAWFNALPNRPFNFTGDFITGTGSNGYGYAEINSLSGASCLVYSVLNSSSSPAGYWGNLSGSTASYSSTLDPEQMVNIAMNFTDFGLDFATVTGPCSNLFGALLFKSRASSSFSSELKDFTGPYSFANFSEVQANAGSDKELNCNNATVALSGSSLTSGVTVSWSALSGNIVSGANSFTPIVNQPGTYVIYVQSPLFSTCVATDTVVVNSNFVAPNVNAGTDKSITCSSPTATLNGSSTTNGATFTWTALPGGSIISGVNSSNAVVGAGCYILTTSNPANGCINTDTVCVIANTQAPAVLISSSANASCFSICDGSATANATGLNAPYSYEWSNGQTSQSISGLCAGAYSVTVTGNNGCSSIASVSISQPSNPLALTVSSTQDANCYGSSDGSISVAATGGTAPYSYLWSNGSVSTSSGPVAAGNYSVTVTDANGCTSITSSLIVSQPPTPLSVNGNNTSNASCFGTPTGSINISASGGTSPYTYSWSNGATTQNISGVVAGVYVLTVTDANGCTVVFSESVGQPNSPLASNSFITTPANCFGGNDGSATVTVSGGTSPYVYLWSNGQNGQTTNGLSAGIYTVSVTDANGCTSTGSVQIVQPTALIPTVNSSQNVGCNGGSNGSINLAVSGGVAPYNYLWSNGSTAQDIASLTSGIYTVTVNDANGCTATISQSITEPSLQLSSSATVNQAVSCFGGSNGNIVVSVSGGTPSYSYSWSNGATTPSINGLSAGNYTLTVTDANGCQNIGVFSITEPAAPLSASQLSSSNVSCNGGANGNVSVTVSGGTSPYLFLWSNGSTTQDLLSVTAGVYTLSVTDANGCSAVLNATVGQPLAPLASTVSVTQNVSCNGGGNGLVNASVSGGTAPYNYLWNNGATTQAVSSLAAGNYTVTVTDANGCTDVSSVSITQPQQSISIQASVTSNISCYNGNNGTISISIIGGTAPYSYMWSNGSTNQNLSQLPAGSYTVTVTDANGCTEQSVSSITQPPGALAANVSVSQNVSCFGGSTGNVDLSVTGGTAPYAYLWSNGAVTEDLANLSSGTYTVTITDANGCNSSATGTINQPLAPISIAVSSSNNVDCFGGSNGSASVSVSGGTAPYTYLWNDGSSNNSILSIPSGTYTVTVTDANGCTSIQSIPISEPAQPLSSSVNVVSNVSCFGGVDGSLSATALGGTPSYSYQWSNGGSGSSLTGLSAGNYTLIVTDANGCTAVVTSSIGQPSSALSLSSTQTTHVSCTGGSNGSIDLTVNGGTQPYNYTWSNGATSEDLSGLSTGTYTVTVLDANGCTSNLSVNISQPQNSLSLSTASLSNVDCFGGSNGNIDLNVAGGTSPYTYLWSNGAVSEDLNGITAGTYTVSVVDANGCDGTAAVTISQPSNALTNTVSVTQQVNCFNGNDGGVDLTVNGGTQPYVYAWSNGSTNQDLTGLAAGVYSVFITDQNGCQDSASVSISQPSSALSLSSSQTIPVSCTGGSNGSIDLTVNGGTQPYNYTWSNGATNEDISGLSTGTYTVTVVDANGCTSNLSVNISQPQNALSLSTSSLSNVDCFGGSNGNIDLNVAGGTSPYIYLWSNGSVSEDLNGITAGTYTVSVVDANGCDGTATVTINQPANALTNTVSVTQQVNCFNGNDGSVDLTVSGGTQPYAYAWSNGSTNQDLTGLAAGVYTVLITDQNGCQDSATITISQPQDSLSTSITSSQQVSCFNGVNGSIDLSIAGGTLPYSYTWSNGAITEDLSGLAAGTYTVSVSDANGCTSVLTTTLTQPLDSLSIQTASTQNIACFGDSTGTIDLSVIGGTAPYQYMWSNGSSTEDLSNLQAGLYTVTVTDVNGCTSNQSVQLSQPSTQLSVSGSTTVADCLNNVGGNITISPAGGTTPYSYNWSTGSTSQNINNLPSSTYTVTITDANGCTAMTDFVIAESSYLLVQITSDEICVGDSAVLSVSVSVPATYQWYYNSSPIAGATNNFFITYAQGFYKCEVNSVCGIVMSDSVEISVRSLSGTSISSNQIICPPETVDLIATGGTTYQWSPATYISDPNSSNPTVYPRETTVYSVLVTDDFGCKTTMSVEVAVVCDTLLIPNGYSPNGDGVNDGYVIEGIENFPGNILYIYNRWGNLIYKARDYQNNWTGECNVSGVYYGKKVPAGTYYYILDLNDGQKPRNGFIILRK
ncbi:MAG: T9SS type B sorting domain-containing protein [Arcticibacter sp.]